MIDDRCHVLLVSQGSSEDAEVHEKAQRVNILLYKGYFMAAEVSLEARERNGV